MLGLPWQLSGKESSCNAGDTGDVGSIPGSGRSPHGGHGNPFQYSCLENHMDRGAWWAAVHRVAKSQTRLKQLSVHTCTHTHTHSIMITLFKLSYISWNSNSLNETAEWAGKKKWMLIFLVFIARYRSISHYICINAVFECYLTVGKYFQMFESELSWHMVLLSRNLTSSKHIGPLRTIRFTVIFKFYPLLLLNFIIIIFLI